MASESSNQINITLGTAGHIDHGKTALVKCLTGCDTDRLKIEKQRGMSIDLGHAPCQVGHKHFGIVDVPGHEHFIKTMVAGAAGMDAVMLVVAADDGIMPQTREHLDILTLLGIRHGLVALTKIDRVDADRVATVRAELHGYLRQTFLADAPIVGVSNLSGEGFPDLIDALDRLVHAIPPRRVDGVFRLPVDRAFSAKGYGTIVAGVPVAGSADVGDEVVLLPEGLSGRIRRIEVYGQSSRRLLAGQCASVNVSQWDHHQIERGQTIAAPGYFEPARWLACRLRLLVADGSTEGRPKLRSGLRVKFHSGTSEVVAAVYPAEETPSAAEGTLLAQLRLETPVIVGPGDPFILRSLSPPRTIGGGRVVETLAARLKTNRPDMLQNLRDRAEAVGDESRWVEYGIRAADGFATDEDSLARRAKLTRPRLRQTLAELQNNGKIVAVAGGLLMHRDTMKIAKKQVLDILRDCHRRRPDSPGPLPAEARDALACDKSLFDHLIQQLMAESLVVENSGRLALAEHRPSFAGPDAQRVEAMESWFKQSAFSPPSLEEAAQRLNLDPREVERLLKILLEHGRLVRVAEGLVFHREAIELAKQRLLDHFAREERFESVQFKYMIDTTRKYALPLLDYFDNVGLTRRVGNTRYLKRR